MAAVALGLVGDAATVYTCAMTNTTRSSRVPFFAALCLFLSAVEYAIPKPLPFMRLGLANLPILISLAMMSKRDVAFLIVLKVLGQALISGTLFSYVFVFSAAGSFASGFAMLLLYALFHKTKLMSNIGLSLAGALANNAAQVAVARVMIFGTQTRYIAPLLFFTGLVTGLVLGVFVNIFCAKSSWYKRLLSEQPDSNTAGGEVSPSLQSPRAESAPVFSAAPSSGSPLDADAKTSRVQFIAAMILFPIFLLHTLFVPKNVSGIVRVCIVWIFVAAFFTMAAIKKRGRIKVLPTIFMTIGITFFALLAPSGRVLLSLGKFRITLDSLLIGLHKSGILSGMVFLSQFAISPHLHLPGKAGIFLGQMFTTFDALTAKRLHFSRGRVIAALDSRLNELWEA